MGLKEDGEKKKKKKKIQGVKQIEYSLEGGKEKKKTRIILTRKELMICDDRKVKQKSFY